MSDNSFIVLIL